MQRRVTSHAKCDSALGITEQGSGDACRVPWANETRTRRPVWSREEEEGCQHPEAWPASQVPRIHTYLESGRKDGKEVITNIRNPKRWPDSADRRASRLGRRFRRVAHT
jgi:hypothetical protein